MVRMSDYVQVERFIEACGCGCGCFRNESGERDLLTMLRSLADSRLVERLVLGPSNSEAVAIATVEESDPKLTPITEDEARTFIEMCLNLPKIKKLKSCLNQLDVPVELLMKPNLRTVLRTVPTRELDANCLAIETAIAGK
jgi:hypothetical protein